MSVRALRRVLQQQESAISDNNDFTTDDELESSTDSPLCFANPFDLLIEQEDEQDQENGCSDDDDTSSIVKNEDSVNKNIATTNSSNKNSKKKKKKKRKELFSITDDVDSLDNTLEDLSFGGQHQSSKKKPGNVNGAQKRREKHILQLDPKFLSEDSELRRIFGSEVVDSFERSNVMGSSSHSRIGRRVRVNNSKKKTIIITPLGHWPRWDESLSMEPLETKDGCNYFRYVRSSTYNIAQRQFEAAKATHNQKAISKILLHHPYHIDSLLTIAENYKHAGEFQKSADTNAKALYALECAFHPSFTLTQNNCQLKYEHETNKPFFTALFTHMNNMDKRGCHRSAMELCKLLISLDSNDPTGALFCIDYFSLRAEKYDWLERFSENALWLYPNFSYSFAICRFYLEREEHLNKNKTKVASSEFMKQALMLHPSVVRKLVVKVPLNERIWSTIVNHSFFGKKESENASLDHLINIYVEKSYLIWRLPELHNYFLKDAALSVIKNMENNINEARDWTRVREEAFASNKNEYSHLMVSHFSDSTPIIPRENYLSHDNGD